MKLQTIVDIAPSPWKIGFEDNILMLGSCFADSMGEQMMQRGLNVTCNPFGTLYNPLSIANAINLQSPIFHWFTTKVYGTRWRIMARSRVLTRPKRSRQ